jgi:hypothetical protein
MTQVRPSQVSRPPIVAVREGRPADVAWRGRTLAACAVLALMVVACAATGLDWRETPAMALGQLAGVICPLILLGVLAWAIAAAGAPRG